MHLKTQLNFNRFIGLRTFLTLLEIVLLWYCRALPAQAQPYAVLHQFGTNIMGLYPQSMLVQGADGALYGTTTAGGWANHGQVFKVNTDGTGYTVLKDFSGADGAVPCAGLLLAGTTLYGTTLYTTTANGGGTNDFGTVFKLNTDGTGFAVLKYFASDDGAYPSAKLVLLNGVLYGTTLTGGSTGDGTVFKLGTDGSGFAVLKTFTGADGGYPIATLLLQDSVLYGTTANGGLYAWGTVFRLNLDGTGFTRLHDFEGPEGGNPQAGLVADGGSLYGTTASGGGAGDGTIFRVNTDGSGFTVLAHFTNSITGSFSTADLVLANGVLYGTTELGGVGASGTVFMLNTNGSNFTVLMDFTNWNDGANCMAGLLLAGSTLYGTAASGGLNNYGTVFKLDVDGSNFSVLLQLAGGDGVSPSGRLLVAGTNCFGATSGGGAAGMGTLFRINIDGTGYRILKDFTNSLDGMSPNGDLALVGNTLFGTTTYGGSNGPGTIFRLNTDGSDFAVLYNFSAMEDNGTGTASYTNVDGGMPAPGLLVSGTTLYGAAVRGGTDAVGTLFSLGTNGTGFTVLHTFPAVTPNPAGSWTNADGAGPLGLALAGSTLYGVASWAGNNTAGTVFELETDGTAFTVLTPFPDPLEGSGPGGPLVVAGTNLYGAAAGGGAGYGYGTVFRLATNASSFTPLKVFTLADGAHPNGGLVWDNGQLYGTTEGGGWQGNGIVFQLGSDGTGFAVLKYFSADDGYGPNAGLVLSGTTLYGATAAGGNLDSGVLFSLSLLPGLPIIAQQPQSQTVAPGTTVDFKVLATGIPTPGYQWFYNGTNAIAGATNSVLELASVVYADAGGYTMVVTNSVGSVTSQVAVLTVPNPAISSEPGSQWAQAGQVVSCTVEAIGTGQLSYQWFKDGMFLTNGGKVSGAQAATLTLSNVLGGDAGGYWVIVTNNSGSVTSAVATLTVMDPVIVGGPAAQNVAAGQNATFTVTAIGTPPLAYQWLKDGAPLADGGNIAGAQTATLTLSPVTNSDAGEYSVIVSNFYGQVTSGAGLTIAPAAAVVVHVFGGGDGALPRAALLVSGTILYGTTMAGGITNDINNYGCGTVFKVNTDGSGFTQLHRFNGSDGQYLAGDLALLGSTLYGTAEEGGTYGRGTLFKVNTDGSAFAVLHHFSGSDGMYPFGGVVVSGGKVYGTTMNGGTNGPGTYGTVFRVNTDGSGFTLLKSFAGGAEGQSPWSGLVLSGGTLFGTTLSGGNTNGSWPGSCGTVFKLNTNGTGFATLYRFTGTNSEYPSGDLWLSGTTLYGTTEWLGSSFQPSYGTVFSLNTDGTGFKVLKDFTNSADGIAADGILSLGSLCLSGSTLYGAAWGGGAGGKGNVFGINTDGTGFSALKSFHGPDGSGPLGGVVLSDRALYGTTQRGGSYDLGVIFAVGWVPVINRAPQTQTAELGSTVDLVANAAGSGPLRYEWFFNSSSPLSSGTGRILELADIQVTQAGAYSVTVSNLFGAAASTPAILQVIAPVPRRPVPAINLLGDAGATLNLDYADTLGLTRAWLPLDTVSLITSPQLYFDVTMPLPPQRYYRVWQNGTAATLPALMPPLLVPAITLNGNIGQSLRLDYLNAVGPTNAWVTLATLTLTNTSQLYFDVSSTGQPRRLYRIVAGQ